MTDTSTREMTIHEALREVVNAVGSVGRDGYNQNQSFAFRSIEGIVNATRAPLYNFGVTVIPTYRSLEQTDHVKSDGRILHRAVLEGTFEFVGPAGDSVSVVTIGEGTDLEGRSNNKAQSASLKYALVQALQIGSGEDSDSHQNESQVQSAPRPQQYAQTGSPVAQMAQSQPAPTTNLQNRVAQAAQQSAPVQQNQGGGEPGMSDGQSRNLFRLYKHVLHWERERYFQEVELVLGKTITSDKELTKRDASEMIRSLKILAGEPVDDGGPSNQGRSVPNEPEPQYASEGQYGHSEESF
jgi:hypothetical protein